MNRSGIILFVLFTISLLLVQVLPLIVEFPQGDTTFVTYDLSQKKMQPDIVTLKGEFIMGGVYYQLNNSYWLTYLTTTFDSRQQNDIDITIRLHNLNTEDHTNSSVVVLRDQVTNAGDKFPYTNLQISNITESSVIFSSIYKNADHYYYQQFDRTGKILQSTRFFDTTATESYFYPSRMMEINDTTIAMIVGKYLTERTSVTDNYILLMNRQTNHMKEIELQFQVSSIVYNQYDGLFYAFYDNQTGEFNTLGTFNWQGKLQQTLGQVAGKLAFLVDNSTLLLQKYKDPSGINPFSPFLIISAMTILLIIIVVIYYWRRQRSNQQTMKIESPYLMYQNER